jgi:hypothetical protein
MRHFTGLSGCTYNGPNFAGLLVSRNVKEAIFERFPVVWFLTIIDGYASFNADDFLTVNHVVDSL